MPTIFWKYGFFIHLSIVTIIVVSAYLGIIPSVFTVIPFSDLIGHALLIGLLAFYLDGLLNFRPLIPGKFTFLRLAPILILLISAIEELAQSFSSRRTSSMWDFTADITGIILLSCLAKLIGRKTSIF